MYFYGWICCKSKNFRRSREINIMNKELIKNELQWLLEAINEQYEAIHRHGEKVPHIEFDILMENVRKFYENMNLLQRLNDPLFSYETIMKPREIAQKSRVEPSTAPPVRKQVPAEPESMIRQPAPAAAVQQDQPVRVAGVQQNQPAPVVAVQQDQPFRVTAVQQDQPVRVAGVQQNQPAHFKPAGPAPVRHEPASNPKKTARSQEIDLFATEEPTFSIRLKDAREKTFGPRVPSERIQNLKTAISINEKFMFINELFDGNLREYNETIETLNGFKKLDQAADYLDLMRKKNFWDTGSNAFRKLKELVERRF